MRVKDLIPLLKETFKSWSEDKVPRLAAALSYYTLFALAPLLLILIAIAGLFFGKQAASGQIAEQIRHTLGPQVAQAITQIIENAHRPRAGIIATIVGVVTLLLGASGVFGQLQEALNTIWEVEPKPGRGLWGLIKGRFLSFTMVLGVGFLLLVSLVLSAAMQALMTFMGHLAPALSAIGPIVDVVATLIVFTLLFAMIYRFLPDAKIEWSDVWIGAAMTAVLFAVGKFLIGLYLGRSSVASSYGAAGSLVVLLLWIYYAAQILFFGAEFTKVYAQRFGSRIVPAPDAEPVTREARAQQGISRRRGTA